MKTVLILFILIFLASCTTPPKKYSVLECCIQCSQSFSKSPAGIGASGVNCGEFSSTQQITPECKEYFSENKMSVKECNSYD